MAMISELTRQEAENIIWENIDNLLPILGISTNKPGSGLYSCPFHEDKNPSLSVSKEKHLIHCFSCNRTYTSPILFFKDVEGKTYQETIKVFESLYNFKIKKTKSDTYENIVISANNELLNTEELVDYLKDRGIKNVNEVITKYPIGSTIFVSKLKEYGITLNKEQISKLTPFGNNSFIFGMVNPYSAEYKVNSIKLRNVILEEKKGDNSKIIATIPKGVNKGIFGPPVNQNIIYFTEGEFDALAVYSAFVDIGKTFNVYALSGTPKKSNEVPQLLKNVEVIYYIPDSPKDKGDKVAIDFLKFMSFDFSGDIFFFDWEKAYEEFSIKIGSDPADVVKAGRGEIFSNPEYYIPADEFLYKVYHRLKAIDPDTAKKYLSSDTGIKNMVLGIPFKYIKSFLDRIDKSHLYDSVTNITDEELYLEEIINALTKEFEALFVLEMKSKPELLLKHKNSRSVLKIRLGENPDTSQLIPYIGDTISWLQSNVPVPDFIVKTSGQSEEGAKDVSLLERDRRFKTMFNRAINKLALMLPKRKDYLVLDSGIHYVDDTLLIVNEKDVFIYNRDSHKWEILNSTVYKDNIILGTKEFAPGLTVEQLNSPKPIKEVYERVKKLIKEIFWFNEEWKYKIITSFIFYAPIHQVNQQKVFLWFNAKRGSGKTALLKILSLGYAGYTYRLIEPAMYFSQVTEPSLRREVSDKALAVFLDEFEQEHYDTIFPLLRQANDSGYIIKAARDDDRKVEKFKVSFCGALGSISISPNPADVSRVIVIKMFLPEEIRRKIPPIEDTLRKYSFEYFKELSRDILISSVNSFVEYNNVKTKLPEDMFRDITEPRALANYRALATVLELVNDQFTEIELEDLLEAFAQENVSEDIQGWVKLEAYLFEVFPIKTPDKSTMDYTLREALKDIHIIDYINKSTIPLRVDLKNKLLLINYNFIDWGKAGPEFNPQKVKIDFTNSPRYVSPRELRKVYKQEPLEGFIYLDVSDLMPTIER